MPAPNAADTAQLKKLFENYDKDKSGAISLQELYPLCCDMGLVLSKSELQAQMSILDSSGNGQVSFEEFTEWYNSHDRFFMKNLSPSGRQQVVELSKHFQSFDKDKSGSIDRNEFKKLYQDLVNKKLINKPLDEILKRLDKNSDGLVSFGEFISLFAIK
ncbi:hypothetical protein EDD86DRAFT_273297 [Gorgonomyces haynaldii]|nr:hypothetical protein EDD86DRAFT_273297 [Gorgonomyces haynaldii]